MILYCIVCYLMMGGIIIADYENVVRVDRESWIAFILSPVVLPVFLGFTLNEKK